MYVLNITWYNYDGGTFVPLCASENEDVLIELRDILFDIIYDKYKTSSAGGRGNRQVAEKIYEECIKAIRKYTIEIPLVVVRDLNTFIKNLLYERKRPTSYSASELFLISQILVIKSKKEE